MAFEHDHSAEAIEKRLSDPPGTTYIRDWVYGGIDGAITTFAIVAGVVGAELSTSIILILGLANLLADGFSMAASNYSGTKSDADDLQRLIEIERRHMELEPEGEREEVRTSLRNKGVTGDDLEHMVRAITSNEKLWLQTMLIEEYGVSPIVPKPLNAALCTFASFILCGAVALIPFILGLPGPFVVSAVLTGCVFFAIGSAKSIWSLSSWWRSGFETLLIGAAAAGVAYLIGHLLKSIV